MMGRQDNQLKITVVDISTYIPKNHLLRKIDEQIDFNFIYEKAERYYSTIGRPSIDPVLLMKILMIGYIYGIKSERRLEEEINLNLAYRYFCRLNLDENAPDHSTFSQNRRRRFTDSTIFREMFNEILIQLIEKQLVTGTNTVSDGTFIPANVSWEKKTELTQVIERSSISYLEELDKELENTEGYKKPVLKKEEKRMMKNTTDPDCGYVNQPTKKGFGYNAQVTVDTEHGIITGVDVNKANIRESDNILRHLKRIKDVTGLSIETLTLDGGYDIGAVYRGLEILGITGYGSTREYPHNPMKQGFVYNPDNDTFICEKGHEMVFSRLIYKKTNSNYFRQYKIKNRACKGCENKVKCTKNNGHCIINASSFYPAFYRNSQRIKAPIYRRLMKLRSIWSEGTFAVLKREHKLVRAVKRGVERVTEECLLAALALNMKRMVKAVR
jgi:transposase